MYFRNTNLFFRCRTNIPNCFHIFRVTRIVTQNCNFFKRGSYEKSKEVEKLVAGLVCFWSTIMGHNFKKKLYKQYKMSFSSRGNLPVYSQSKIKFLRLCRMGRKNHIPKSLFQLGGHFFAEQLGTTISTVQKGSRRSV